MDAKTLARSAGRHGREHPQGFATCRHSGRSTPGLCDPCCATKKTVTEGLCGGRGYGIFNHMGALETTDLL